MVEIKADNGCVVATVSAANPNIHGCAEGIWLEVKAQDGSRPTLCVIKDKPDGTFNGDWYIGMYRDAKNAPLGCDLALRFTQDGPVIQVIKGKEVKQLSLFDLFTSGVEVPNKQGTDISSNSGVNVNQGVSVEVSKGNITPQPHVPDSKGKA